jgi:hypothetical protein
MLNRDCTILSLRALSISNQMGQKFGVQFDQAHTALQAGE